MKKVLFRIGVLVAPLSFLAMNAGVAEAATFYPKPVIQDGYCNAQLVIDSNHENTGHDYARGEFWTDPGIYSRHCYGWLETNKYDGRGYVRVSSVYVVDKTDTYDTTGWHYDGSGYRSRVCMYYTYQGTFDVWTRSDTTCSYSY